MKKIGGVIVALALVFIAWKQFSTLDVQGYWHASIEIPDNTVKFDYRIGGRGLDGWASIAGAPDRHLDNVELQRKHIRFDLPIAGHVYHLEGTALNRKIDGSWRLDNGTTGLWHAERYSLKRG